MPYLQKPGRNRSCDMTMQHTCLFGPTAAVLVHTYSTAAIHEEVLMKMPPFCASTSLPERLVAGAACCSSVLAEALCACCHVADIHKFSVAN